MEISEEILSIPPYISTAWKNISALHLEGSELIITLQNGTSIKVPSQSSELLEKIFFTHADYLKNQTRKKRPKAPRKPAFENFDFNLAMGPDLDGMPGISSMMQHNPEMADSPNLPKEILEKISAVTKALDIEMTNSDGIPKAEPHCNCTYCQIARALVGEPPKEDEPVQEEIVTDADLTFREWEIQQVGDKIYIVTNPLNKDESFQVFLGTPVGCTCGQEGCEHIKAVLQS